MKRFIDFLHSRNVEIADVSISDVNSYIQYRVIAKEVKPATIKKDLSAIKSFLKWADYDLHLHKIEYTYKDTSKEIHPETLNPDEVEKIIRDAKCSGKPRDYAVVILIAKTGILISELINFKTIDYNKDNAELYLQKKNSGRKIKLDHDTNLAIMMHLMFQKKSTEFLFHSNLNNGPYSARGIQKILEGLGTTQRKLRNSMADRLVHEGLEIEDIMDLTGLKTSGMLGRYTK